MSLKSRIGCRAFLAPLLSFAITTVASASEASSIAVQADGVTADAGRFTLNMRVWNCTNRDLSVELGTLPWGQDTLGLVVYKGEGMGHALKRVYPVDDVASREITIPAGGSVTGDVNLDLKFIELPKIKDQSDVVVFWVYDGAGTHLPSVGRFGGMIPLIQKPFVKMNRESACRM